MTVNRPLELLGHFSGNDRDAQGDVDFGYHELLFSFIQTICSTRARKGVCKTRFPTFHGSASIAFVTSYTRDQNSVVSHATCKQSTIHLIPSTLICTMKTTIDFTTDCLI
jgi:hypothetical protein